LPLVSVVVPVHGVEDYVLACLESIAAQPVSDHEVVVVDDGSPDGSAPLVQQHLEKDPRVTLVRQDNAGLGAARNVGVRLARGTYLTFVDSDDVLPPDAWGAMVSTLERTGSDLAVGLALRDDGERRWATPLMQRNHERPLLRTSVDESPLLLADVFAWNKLYRRDFWERERLSFPEGTRYEDQPALTRALLAARGVDVLTETVYHWAVRADRSSITQRRHEMADLVDRFQTKAASARDVLDHGVHDVSDCFFAEVLPVDMWEYFRAVPGCTDEYWTTLVAGVRDLWNASTVPFERTAVPPHQRLMGWLVAQDRRRDLEDLLAWIDTHRPLPFRGDELDHPLRGEPGMPRFARIAGTAR